MAGIIAQITRANRNRIDNRREHVSIAKCMYHIKPFDKTFEREVSLLLLIKGPYTNHVAIFSEF